jgi:hypothetical protein
MAVFGRLPAMQNRPTVTIRFEHLLSPIAVIQISENGVKKRAASGQKQPMATQPI